ncbi:hypothetical protein ELI38_29535 (plasmid) [Rhizobium leguminosarum]|uniref:hypothetical protein n=1 Tax=Rhizobium leguminosarum TaxID=384 RepID=UPI001031E02A|nr:hypothetical protein [Rhizobium leguminosarum]NKK93918.1 hypothetical protein [Rhizobium leguminosarum bv. viciae]TAU86576.1 hypothetical protein ELI38_29535 [Rhizobium leguminosarum]TAU99398.1 hypothetical protein ELI37_29695 [Rhizobium leguminosarum]TAW41436.1 hypothetical protein ELI14_32485 [Rhizobium leguminosarum]TAY26740.1 hypothetical protein ELH89_30145 [Rhizobium leguminosarum]
MASLTNSATIAADAIPARKLVGCIDEAIAGTSTIVLWGCEAADHACFGPTLLDLPNDIFRQLRHRLLHKNCTKPLIKIVCAVPSKGEN